MPLLAAGVWQTPQSQQVVERLVGALQTRMPHVEQVRFPQAMIAYGSDSAPPSHCLPLHDHVGALCGFGLGTFFQHQNTDLHSRLRAPLLLRDIAPEHASRFAQQVWGKYVVIGYDAQTKSLHLMRDQAGMQTLFVSPLADGWIAASELHLLMQAFPDSELDWSYFAAAASFGFAKHTSQTPFRNVTELDPGMLWTVRSSEVPLLTTLWNPATLLQTKAVPVSDLETMHEMLRATLRAWATNYSGIGVTLSGGLDSSTLLALLKEACPDLPLVGLHVGYEKLGFVDERALAERVTQHLHVPLCTLDGSDCLPLAPTPVLQHWRNKPSFELFLEKRQSLFIEQAHAAGCDGLMDGEGGDLVFFQQPYHYLLDYLSYGLPRFWQEVKDAGRIGYTSGYAIARELLRLRRRRQLTPYDGPYTRVRGARKALLPSWLRIPPILRKPYTHTRFYQDASSLSLRQLVHATGIYSYGGFFSRGWYPQTPHEFLSPLLSTPIVETALRLPVHLLNSGGIGRLAWRQIAARLLPAEIAWRHTKGNFIGRDLLSIRAYRSRVESLLYEGRLARQGWIDCDMLRRNLALAFQGDSSVITPGLTYALVIELWFEAWGLQ